MIDFHTHCLPAVDDGAQSVEAAMQMLRESVKCGVNTVVATPHFYYGEQTVEEFLQKRDSALALLRQACERESLPIRIIPGAEVLVREGLSKIDLSPLCIEGTQCVLLELPFMSPPSWLLEEIENIVFDQKLVVMYAHLDRYLPWYSEEDVAEITDVPGLLVQLNASSLGSRRACRRLQRWLPAVKRLALGTDMHAPNTCDKDMAKAYAHLKHMAFGRDWIDHIGRCEAAFEQRWQ